MMRLSDHVALTDDDQDPAGFSDATAGVPRVRRTTKIRLDDLSLRGEKKDSLSCVLIYAFPLMYVPPSSE